MSDPLQQLLHETDSSAAVKSGPAAADLAQRVLSANRKAHLRKSISVVAMILIGSLAAMLVLRSGRSSHLDFQAQLPSEPRKSDPEVNTRLNEQMNQIQTEIAEREAIIARLILQEKQDQLNEKLARLRSLPTTDDVIERAASATVFQTDRMLQSAHLPASAIRAYSEVIDNFPHTASADLARQRLTAIKTEG